MGRPWKWPPGVCAAIWCGHVNVELTYPCDGCGEPGHIGMRFLDDPRCSFGFGVFGSELQHASPLARELIAYANACGAKPAAPGGDHGE